MNNKKGSLMEWIAGFIIGSFIADKLLEKPKPLNDKEFIVETSRPEKQIDDFEERTSEIMNKIESKSFNSVTSNKTIKDQLEFVLQMTERDYLDLKEKYRDEGTRLTLANDWHDYVFSISSIGRALNRLNEDPLNFAAANPNDKNGAIFINAKHAKRIKIEKKFQGLLGNKFIDRWAEYTRKNNPETLSLESYINENIEII